jgi:hypothetical protein
VPLLDTLREGLATWARDQAADGEASSQARRAAATVGRAARALLAGLTLRATVAVADVELDPTRVMESWRDDQRVADDALSFYHASFNAMRDAVDDFVHDDEGRTVRRVVIFIDDLDRCLPLSALEVLESMKLFFDLDGFVFVVGLDQTVIERSIELKYEGRPGAEMVNGGNGDPRPGAPDAVKARVSATDYVKKIFQVPFAVPRISTADLRPFFNGLVSHAGLPDEQRQDLNDVVWAHVDSATGVDAGSVNPREVKRLINAYTLQMKMLSAKLGRAPDPHVVLAIQTMQFRSDWRELYNLLAADPQLFVDAVNRVMNDPEGRTEFFLRPEPLPSAFLAYLRGPAAPLLTEQELDVYITTAETTGSSNPRITEARTLVAELQRLLGRVGDDPELTEKDAVAELSSKIGRLHELVQQGTTPQSYFAMEAQRLARALRDAVKDVKQPSPDPPEQEPPWVRRVRDVLVKLDENLSEMRRETQFGPVVA